MYKLVIEVKEVEYEALGFESHDKNDNDGEQEEEGVWVKIETMRRSESKRKLMDKLNLW